ncbi:MAG: hypothetical protein F2745_03345 [Actinobacteria bacterium]|jgi:hypothetical protein|uniref:Unannotated protein n=1 Tax=freshwater metagenome TaxID=449393 RepID=A0A6J6Y6U5_9ZZZZ|nr:hypothetical protein [Actinomycetota bacterium]
MRGYIALTPNELATFLAKGESNFPRAFITTQEFFENNAEVDEEEREFELSCLAAQESRSTQGVKAQVGLALAVDLKSAQTGTEEGSQVLLLQPISWVQVEALLVAESLEPELTWYATQEISEVLPQWVK